MRVFEYRDQLIADYAAYVRSFIEIRDARIREHVDRLLEEGLLWPEPLIQLNPSFEPGRWVDDLVADGVLHSLCAKVFRREKDREEVKGEGRRLRLHRHQEEAILTARKGESYVLTTGTGSGKSLAYIVPIVDHVLRRGSGKGIRAIVVYPMNALANSQAGELRKFVCEGFPNGAGPVTFARYTGQESDEDRQKILDSPPDILLTNFVMLELLLTRPFERKLIDAAQGLRFLVLDELHTYRGRQGADVALLVRRVRDRMVAGELQCVGTSATLAAGGTWAEQGAEVARVASLLFGTTVRPGSVIGETLRRATRPRPENDPAWLAQLRATVETPGHGLPTDYDTFLAHPLATWLETTFGTTEEAGSGRLVRIRTPRSVLGEDGAARDLAALTGCDEETCADAIRTGLLSGYLARHPETGDPAFAFRIHQFISRGDTVFATVEPEAERHVTVHGQRFVPGDRSRVLLPLVFCRECGQEYYCVRRREDDGGASFEPREPSDRAKDGHTEAGFLFFSSENPWPADDASVIDRLPEDWVEERPSGWRVKPHKKKALPRPVHVRPDGTESAAGDGHPCHFVTAPFRFCLNCGVAYGSRQVSDFGKVGALGSEGRSTATTILSLSAIRQIRAQKTLPEKAQKLLSFTDNRQDASLQAGHFNDFIEIGVLRAGLYRAVVDAGPSGIEHHDLTQRVFQALGLPFATYARDPDVKFLARTDTERAFRDVLGYRIYRDLKRGWRITLPNLEQCGLLKIRYRSLDGLAADEETWSGADPALAALRPDQREEILHTLLDFMRRELALKVDFLEPHRQDSLRQLSNARLVEPWAIDESDVLEQARVLYPRSAQEDDRRDSVFLSSRGGFGQFLGRASILGDRWKALDQAGREGLIRALLEALRVAGIVERVVEADGPDDVPGYQLNAGALVWQAGDGSASAHDPIRVPHPPKDGGRTNRFFIDFYRRLALDVHDLRAREHTAQVPADEREKREKLFREGRLPVLYCSPTMELGVDISELNVVNMRNVPPTPANYAQRSGRAGRSGQPALVFSYCAAGSPHDQYFFRRPSQMVAGAVAPPRLDLANEDLVRAHVHAVWVAETGVSLGKSLKDVLDTAGDEPSLTLQSGIRNDVENPGALERARTRARAVLENLRPELDDAGWYTEGWLDRELDQVVGRFDSACGRWRGLFRAALGQAKAQNRVIQDASASPEARRMAERLRAEAESQLKLLVDVEKIVQSDFYSYRYFASEGFLPGYNFPRLPLSAYIPGRRTRDEDEFLSRPRFLAISEFGPRAVVYHEGSRYVINKVILPVREEAGLTGEAKICRHCGWLHSLAAEAGPDLCARCGTELPGGMKGLLRLQNVSTRRKDRINSDEEERLRLGYELKTAVRFSDHGEHVARFASVRVDGGESVRLDYGPAATLWRLNLGWIRRSDPNQLGFVLDVERGYWAKNDDVDPTDDGDVLSARRERVVPYVEDRRNCLLVTFAEEQPVSVMASLQAALKNAIQIQYQLEESELAAEPLPTRKERRHLLLYEAAEGGAGVLRRLVDEPAAFVAVVRRAQELCHFDPDTGEDLRRAPTSKDDCEAACYDCLLSYGNQPDHRILDRQAIRDLLASLAGATVELSAAGVPANVHLEELSRKAGSELERRWLDWMHARQLRLPSRGQVLVADAATRPDFLYDGHALAIYVDGTPHDFPERQERDRKQETALEDLGWSVVRFGHRDDWSAVVAKYPEIFGTPVEAGGAASAVAPGFDLSLFPAAWRGVVTALLAEPGVTVDAGEDIVEGSLVVGKSVAAVRRGAGRLAVLDESAGGAAETEAAFGKRGLPALRLSPGADASARILDRLKEIEK